MQIWCLQDWLPRNGTLPRTHLGFTNFYRKFIGNYSNIAWPLLNLTKTDEMWKWDKPHQNAFNRLKNCFLNKPILHLPDTSKPFAIATDASKYASGGVLLQANSNGEWHPCSYLSQSFLTVERNYDIYDRELLAIIRGLKMCHHYLRGSPFPIQIFTDHKTYCTSRNSKIWIRDKRNGC